VIEEILLDNGLRVVVERLPSSVVGLAVAVGAGSYYDPPGLEGLSHLAEHMVFRSNEYFTSREIDERLELSGCEGDAYTDRDHLVIAFQCVPESLRVAADMLAKLVAAREYREEEFDAEKNVVIREIEGYNAEPHDRIVRLAFTAGLGPAGAPIEGGIESVRKASIEDFAAFKDRLFTAPNLVVAVSGPVSREDVQTVIKAFEGVPPGRRVHPPYPEARPSNIAEEAASEGSAQVALSLTLPGYRVLSKHIGEARAAIFNLSSGATSAMYRALRLDLSLVYSYTASLTVYKPYSLAVLVAFDVDPSKVEEAHEALKEKVWEELGRLVSQQGYIEGRKRFLKYLARLDRVQMMDNAASLAASALTHGRAKGYRERLEEVLRADWSFFDLRGLASALSTAILTPRG
jgi:zinc protease